jgi:hypothetical protein
MKQVISKCGNICSSCPWGVWSRKGQTEEEWDSFFKDVKKYVGYSPTKNPCHGCQTPNDNLSKDVGVHNFLRGCSARKCAFYNDIRNCAYCSRYPCDKIKSLNVGNSREDAEARIGESIPNDKYLAYVRVFEGKKTLNEIRSSLSPDKIQEVKVVDAKPPRIVAFPKVSKKHMKYQSLHDVLSTILNSNLELSDTDTLAGQEMLKDRRILLLRLLWITANYGSLKADTLTVDSITITTHKKGTSGFPTSEGIWSRWLGILSKIGIHGEMELAQVGREQLISPMGWLRDRIRGSDEPAWHLRISLDEKLGGRASLKLLQSYAKSLDNEYGKRAYSRFNKADMRLFEEISTQV